MGPSVPGVMSGTKDNGVRISTSWSMTKSRILGGQFASLEASARMRARSARSL